MRTLRTFGCLLLILSLVSPAWAQYNVPPTAGCTSGTANRWDGSSWSCETAGGGTTIPAGLITFVVTGTCPTGWTEVTALAGKTLFGTLNANADVGTTGGNDTITPTVNSLTAAAQTVNSLTAAAQVISWPAGVPVFAGAALGTHLHTAGTYVNAWPAGVPTFAGNALAGHAHELPWQIPSTTTIRQIAVATFGTGTSRAATAVSAAGTANTTSAAVALSQSVGAGTPAGTVAWPAGVPTISGSSQAITAGTPAGTVAWPAGVPTNATSAVTGTLNASAVTGTLNSFDNRSAFTKVIFCSKN